MITRRDLAARRAALRAKIARRRPAPRADDREPRRRWLLLLLLLLLLFLLPCEPPPAPQAAAPCPAPPVAAAAPTTAPAPAPAKVAKKKRPRFPSPAPEPLPWLAAFRLQVAARSPRLAECFTGADRPGALKWTTAVEPRDGRVSDHTFEPTLASGDLTSAQRACVVAVLSEPTYRLDAGTAPSTPPRVAMVIEF